MTNLKEGVSKINKVGPKYEKLLEKLNIKTVGDFIYYFPHKYTDYSKYSKIRDLRVGDVITVKAILSDISNIFTKNGKRLTKATISDETGRFDVIWFNMHYLVKSLKRGQEYNFFGKVDEFSHKPVFLTPDIEELTEKIPLHSGRLVPIYAETNGITSKWIRSRMNTLLNSLALDEFIPDNITQTKKLPDINIAFSQIHFPSSLNNAQMAKERFIFEEIFLDLLQVEKFKQERNESKKSVNMSEQNNFVEFFKILPFELTDSQQTALREIIDDLKKTTPMNRLLEGDVGTGKTVVAAGAAYFTHLNGYKSVYMAPTEILANQHFQTFTQLLNKLDVKIGLLTGSSKPKVIKDIADSNIVIGTHALLYTKDAFDNVGLVIVDEQHRFGVEQRTLLTTITNTLGELPNMLTMTATPIPRTLALTLYGDLDISVLKTHPKSERKVTTKVISQKDREKAYSWIKKQNTPTFIVCPSINQSESEMFENVKAAEDEFLLLQSGPLRDVKMGLLHGRMRPKEKDDIISKFKRGEIKILVSTPVIEVGIDIPEATTIVIESAERYGLASLHQLRGRVGRNGDQGYCLLIPSTDSQNALSRLRNMENISNGMELAELDLKLRGQGDIFGTMQHGEKRFRFADDFSVERIEDAKIWVQKVFPEISKYPKLLEKLNESRSKFVGTN